MGELSWTQVMLLSIIPLGQLFARIKYFHGSLDKWYLMFPLLQIFPLSIGPMLMMKFGYIADGTGEDPTDKIMLLPIIAKFVIPFILPHIIDEDSETLTNIVSFILQLLTIMTANLTRRYINCNSITVNSVGKAGMDSVIAHGIAELLPFIFSFIPIIGMVYSVIEMIPVVGDFVHTIFWSLGFAGTYTIINMFNQDNMEKFCSTPFTGNTQDKIPFFACLIILVVINGLNALSPI